MTCLFVESKRPFEKIIKNLHATLTKKLRRQINVLHCAKEKPVTRQRLFKMLIEKECGVMTIYLKKSKVYTRLHDEKHVLYNYVTNILLDRIFSKRILTVGKKIALIASKRETNKFLNENFSDYLNRQMKDAHGVNFQVLIKTPAEEKTLQVVDFLSWAIFRKYEFLDDRYYNVFKSKIVEENALFP